MKLFNLFRTASACLAIFSAGCAAASVITVTFPAYTGPFIDSGSAQTAIIGTQAITIPPGEHIIAAQISGSFGPGDSCNDNCPGSAQGEIRLDAITVASCDSEAKTCGNLIKAKYWAFDLSAAQFATLTDGSVTLSAVQTEFGIMILGATKLIIVTAANATAPSNCAITQNPPGSVAPGTQVTLTVNCANSPTNYQWTVNGATIGTSQSIQPAPTQTTTYTVTASNEVGQASPQSATVVVAVNPPSQPSAISYVSGDNQLGNPGAVLPSPLVVKVVNAQGNPFSTAQFITQVTGGAGTLTLLTPQPADGIYRFNFQLGAETTARTVTICLASNPALCVVFHVGTFEQVVIVPAKQLLGPQAATAIGAPTIQFYNVRRRLEQIRLWGNPSVTQGLNISYDGQSLPPLSALALAPLDKDGKPRLKAVDSNEGSLQTGGGAAADKPDPFERWSVFVNGNIEVGRQSTVDNQTGFKLNTKGVTVGADYRFAGNHALGASVGYLKGDADLDAGAGDQDAKGYSFSLYGTYVPAENAYIDGIVNWGHNRYDSQRLTPISSFDSKTNGNQWGLAVSIGYAFNRGPLALTPYGRVEYVDAKVDGFTETGNPNEALIIGDQRVKVTTLTLGGTASYAISTSWGVLLPNARLEFQHLAQSNVNDVSARIASSSPTQIQILGPDKNFGNFAAGVTAVFGTGVSAFFNYQQVFGKSNVSDRLYTLGLNVGF